MKCITYEPNRLTNVVNNLNDDIENVDFKLTYRKSSKDFTRNRKLGFVDYINMGLFCGKSSLQTNINHYLSEKMGDNKMKYTKQAYSKGRQRIKAEAFKHLIHTTAKSFYEIDGYKTIKGYLLLAIDGSDFNLPNTPQLRDFFGEQKTNTGGQVQALTSTLYDVLNGVVLETEIEPYNSDERTLALNHIRDFRKNYNMDAIVTMDRGYPSFNLIYEIEQNSTKFLMRCNKNNFLKEIRDLVGNDEVITIKRDDREILVRVVTVSIKQKQYTFLTNLSDKEYSSADIAELYRLRWGIETLYKKLKCKMEIENFTGLDVLCVKQDYFASLVLSNVVAAAVSDGQILLDDANKNKALTREYKINNTFAISEIKYRFIRMMCIDNNHERQHEFDSIISSLINNVVVVQPERSAPHTSKHKCNRFNINNKRTIF